MAGYLKNISDHFDKEIQKKLLSVATKPSIMTCLGINRQHRKISDAS
jgi:hypothetical protein